MSIDTSTAVARENARRSDGRFGTQAKDETTVDLDARWSFPEPQLHLDFTPGAIREHFDGDDELAVEDLTDEELRVIGTRALLDDRVYRAFHDALVSGVEEVRAERPAPAPAPSGIGVFAVSEDSEAQAIEDLDVTAVRTDAYDALKDFPDDYTVTTVLWDEEADEDAETFQVNLDEVRDNAGQYVTLLGSIESRSAGWFSGTGPHGIATAYDEWRDDPDDPYSPIVVGKAHAWYCDQQKDPR